MEAAYINTENVFSVFEPVDETAVLFILVGKLQSLIPAVSLDV